MMTMMMMVLMACAAIAAGKLQIGKITDVVMLLRRDNKKFSDSQKLAPMLDVITFNARQILKWKSPTLHLFVHKSDKEKIIDALSPADPAVIDKYIKFVSINKAMMSPPLVYFRSIYNHSSVNEFEYERSCFERWVIFQHYFASSGVWTNRAAADLIFFIDGDVALFEDPNTIIHNVVQSQAKYDDVTAVEFFHIGWGSANALTHMALQRFASMIVSLYTNTNGERFQSFLEKYGESSYHHLNVSWHVSDMYMQIYFADKCKQEKTFFSLSHQIGLVLYGGDGKKVCFVAESLRGDTDPQNIDFKSKPPLLTKGPSIKGDERIPACLIHFAGDSKKYAHALIA